MASLVNVRVLLERVQDGLDLVLLLADAPQGAAFAAAWPTR